MKKICRVSKEDRENMAETELMDQERFLKIKLEKDSVINFNNLEYLLKLASKV